MTNFASKYNRGLGFTRKAVENAIYTNLKELFGKYGEKKMYVIQALYINTKGKYGDSPIALVNGNLVNLPSHLTETVKEMLKDEELIQAINDDEFGFTIYHYEKDGKQGYSVNWVDIPF